MDSPIPQSPTVRHDHHKSMAIRKKDWKIFLSHAQDKGGNQVFLLREALYASSLQYFQQVYNTNKNTNNYLFLNGGTSDVQDGDSTEIDFDNNPEYIPLTIWNDQDEEATFSNMEYGIKHSAYVLLYLTSGMLLRPAVQFEIHTALQHNKPIIFIADGVPVQASQKPTFDVSKRKQIPHPDGSVSIVETTTTITIVPPVTMTPSPSSTTTTTSDPSVSFSTVSFDDLLEEGEKFSTDADNIFQGFVYLTPSDFIKLRNTFIEQGGMNNVIRFYPDYTRLFSITIDGIRKALRLPALDSNFRFPRIHSNDPDFPKNKYVLPQSTRSVQTGSSNSKDYNDTSSLLFRMRRPLPQPSPLFSSLSPSSSLVPSAVSSIDIAREPLGPSDILIFSSSSLHGLCQATFLRVTFTYRCSRRSLIIRTISDSNNYTKKQIEALIDCTNCILVILTKDVWRSPTIVTMVSHILTLSKSANHTTNISGSIVTNTNSTKNTERNPNSRYGFIFESDTRYGGENMSSIMEYCPKYLKGVFSTYMAVRFERKKEQRETFIRELLMNRVGVVSSKDTGGICRPPELPLGYQELPIRTLLDRIYRELIRDQCLIVATGGWGGVGKTTIATAIAHDKRINNYFDDVFWLSIGQVRNRRYLFNKLLLLYHELQNCTGASSTDTTILESGIFLPNDGSGMVLHHGKEPPTIEATAKEISTYLNNRASLIVIDDCWYSLQFLIFLGILNPNQLRDTSVQLLGSITRTVSAETINSTVIPTFPRKRSKIFFTTRFINKFEDAVRKSHLVQFLSNPFTMNSWLGIHRSDTDASSAISSLMLPYDVLPSNMKRRSIYTTIEIDKLDNISAIRMLVEKSGLFPSVDKYTLEKDLRVQSLLRPIFQIIGTLPFSVCLMGAYFRTKLERLWNTNPDTEEQIVVECVKELMYYKQLETEPHLPAGTINSNTINTTKTTPLLRIAQRSADNALSSDLIFSRLDHLSLESTNRTIRSQNSTPSSNEFLHGRWLMNPIFRNALEIQNNEWYQYIQTYQAIQLTLSAIFTSYDIIHFAMFGLFTDDVFLHYSILRTCWNKDDESTKRLLYRLSDAGILKLDDHENNELFVMLHDLALDFARALCCIVSEMDSQSTESRQARNSTGIAESSTLIGPKHSPHVDYSFHSLHKYLLIRLATASIPFYTPNDNIPIRVTFSEKCEVPSQGKLSSTMIPEYDGLTQPNQYNISEGDSTPQETLNTSVISFVRPWWKIHHETPIGKYILQNLWLHLFRAGLMNELKYLATHFDWLRMHIGSIGFSSFLIEYYRYALAKANEEDILKTERLRSDATTLSSISYGVRPHPISLLNESSVGSDIGTDESLPYFYTLYYKALKLCTSLNYVSSSVIRNGTNLATQLLGRLLRYRGFYPLELDPLLYNCEQWCRMYNSVVPIKLFLTHPGSLIDSLLSGHTQQVWCVEMCNKDYLASGSEDNTIRIWNLQTGELDKILEGHTNSVTFLRKLSAERLLSASNDGTIRVWNVYSGIQEYVNSEWNSPVTCLKIHKYNSSVVLIGRLDGSVQLISLANLTDEENALNIPINSKKDNPLNKSMQKLSSSVAVVTKKDQMTSNVEFIYNDLPQRSKTTVEGILSNVKIIAESETKDKIDKELIGSVSQRMEDSRNSSALPSMFRVVVTTGKSSYLPFIEEELNKPGRTKPVFSPSNPTMYSLELWSIIIEDVPTVHEEHSWPPFSTSIASLVELPNECIAIGLGDSRILIVKTIAPFETFQELQQHTKSISILVFSSIDQVLLSGAEDLTVCVWRIMNDSSRASTLVSDSSPISEYATTSRPQGSHIDGTVDTPDPLVVRGRTEEIDISIHRDEWTCINQVQTHHKVYINCIQRLRDGRYVTSGGIGNSQLAIWDILVAKTVVDCDFRLDKHTSGITAVTIDENGRIASAGKDRLVVVWYIPSNRNRVNHLAPSLSTHKFPLIERHTRSITSILLFSSSSSKTVTRSVSSVVSYDSMVSDYRIVTSSWDRRAHIWNSFTGQKIGTIQHDRAYISKLLWLTPEMLILGGDYGEIVVWYFTSLSYPNQPSPLLSASSSNDTPPRRMIDRNSFTINGISSTYDNSNTITNNMINDSSTSNANFQSLSFTDTAVRLQPLIDTQRFESFVSFGNVLNENKCSLSLPISDSSLTLSSIPLCTFPYRSTNRDGTKTLCSVNYPTMWQQFPIHTKVVDSLSKTNITNDQNTSSSITSMDTRVERYQLIALVAKKNSETNSNDTNIHVWNIFVYPEVLISYPIPIGVPPSSNPISVDNTPFEKVSGTPKINMETPKTNINNENVTITLPVRSTKVPKVITECTTLLGQLDEITDVIRLTSPLSATPYLASASTDSTIQFWDIHSFMDTVNIPSPFSSLISSSAVVGSISETITAPTTPISNDRVKDKNKSNLRDTYFPANTESSVRSVESSSVGIRYIGKGHAKKVNKILGIHNDRYIVSCSDDCTIKLWENPLYSKNNGNSNDSPKTSPISFACIDTLIGHEAPITLLNLIPELPSGTDKTKSKNYDYYLLSACKKHIICMWKISISSHVQSNSMNPSLSVSHVCKRQFIGHEADIRCLVGFRIPQSAPTPSQRLITTPINQNTSLQLSFSRSNSSPDSAIRTENSNLATTGLSVSPSNTSAVTSDHYTILGGLNAPETDILLIGSTSKDKTFRLWNGTVPVTEDNNMNTDKSLSSSHSSRMTLMSSSSYAVKDSETNRNESFYALCTVQCDDAPTCIEYIPASKRLCVGMENGMVGFFDMQPVLDSFFE